MASIVAAWPTVALGQVMRQRKLFIQIDDTMEYRRCRAQLHAQGVVLRDIVAGAEVKTKSQQVCRPGEFLVAEIDAKVGGFGIVPPALDRAIVSSHYFLFVLDESRLDQRFFDFYIRTPSFQEQVQAQGSTNYAAVRPQDVLNYTVPLPPLDEQRRIVARVEELAARIEEARGLRREAIVETDTVVPRVLEQLQLCDGDTVLGDFITLQHGYAFESHWFSDHGIRLVRNINIGHGSIRWDDVALLPDEHRRDELQRFELHAGDILLSLNRPVISTGVKVVRVQPEDTPSLLVQRVGRVQFLRDGLLPEFLFEWFNSPQFVGALWTRLHGVPYVASKDIERIPFAPPPLEEQVQFVAHAQEVRTRACALRELQVETAASLESLLASILDKAFRGEL